MHQETERFEFGKRGSAPVVTTVLIASGFIFLIQMILPYTMMRYFALWPLGVPSGAALPDGMPAGEFQLWQLLTYAFLHGSFFHLFINMFVLWMFGPPIEIGWGSRRFFIYYVVCVLGAGAVQLIVVSTGAFSPTVGASGGVYGILLAFAMMFPNRYILLIFPPIPMKAKYFVIFIGTVELWFGITGTQQGVAHFAHLAGMVFGLILIQYWGGRPPFSSGGGKPN